MTQIVPPAEIQELFCPLLADIYAVKYHSKTIHFSLKRGEYTYRYFNGKSGAIYCYTPHPSTDGDYFVWTYVPKGKGSRSGKASRFSMKGIVRCATRKTAKSKAIKRWQSDTK
jgi:hypothetical protein